MKVRTGFVSNSSSSSFVVAFPKGIELTEEALHNYLFSGGEETICAYDWLGKITSWDVVKSILHDMKEQREVLDKPDGHEDRVDHKEKIFSVFEDEFPGAPASVWDRLPRNFYNMPNDRQEAARLYAEEQYLAEAEKFNEFLEGELAKQFSGKDVELFYFVFNDNDGAFWSTMEHGDVFHNVKHWRQSNH
jgi:hypothetical protein